MNIDKDTILNLLRSNGQDAEADQAQQELPDQVDTDQHAGLLEKFGINPADLIAKFTGGKRGRHRRRAGQTAVDRATVDASVDDHGPSPRPADPDSPEGLGDSASPAAARGGRRGHPGPLDRRTILLAAITLIDRHDLRHLTMRRLGAQLGVEGDGAVSLHPRPGRPAGRDRRTGHRRPVRRPGGAPDGRPTGRTTCSASPTGCGGSPWPTPRCSRWSRPGHPRPRGCGRRCGACGGWNRSWTPCTSAGSPTPGVSAPTGRSPVSCSATCCSRCPRRAPTSARSSRPTRTTHPPPTSAEYPRLKSLEPELSQDHSADEFDEALETLLDRIDLLDHHRPATAQAHRSPTPYHHHPCAVHDHCPTRELHHPSRPDRDQQRRKG